jgi:glycine/D-amino acid oxidase-like deaminating enzyme
VKIAVVGAGFCGLALSWHLLHAGAKVDLYDKKGVGAGASGLASGLLHPYAGEQVRRSWRASEAMDAARELLALAQTHSGKPVADFSGILRLTEKEEQRSTFLEHAKQYGDVQPVGEDQFILSSGITVHSQTYLEGLFACCQSKGLRFFHKEISSLKRLHSYDEVVLCIGAGILRFEGMQGLPCSATRGQGLICEWPQGRALIEQSRLGKGHVAKIPDSNLFHLGATYERQDPREEPDVHFAVQDLEPKAKRLIENLGDLQVRDCKAGVRVVRRGHYLPLIGSLDGIWVMTAMGSRGLLYHAYFSKILSQAILNEDQSLIPNEINLALFKNKALAYNHQA